MEKENKTMTKITGIRLSDEEVKVIKDAIHIIEAAYKKSGVECFKNMLDAYKDISSGFCNGSLFTRKDDED